MKDLSKDENISVVLHKDALNTKYSVFGAAQPNDAWKITT